MNRTTLRIKAKYQWYGMTQKIRDFVKTCSTCNLHKKPNRKAKCPLTQFHAGAPMERVHLDFLGPLPETKFGNAHVLVMVDQFSKWMECIPLPAQTAEHTARAAVNEFFSRFGFPFQVFTDQGRNFESKLFKSICEILQMHKARTTPYRPSSNGQAERCNRTLMDAVRCFVSKQQDNWDEHLAQLAGAVRSSVNRSTGFTPNMLMLGREVNQPVDLLYSVPGAKTDESQDEYVMRLRDAITSAHEIARNTLKTTQNTMKRDYDVRILEREYKIGDLVYVLDTAKIKGRAKKLDPPWKGPGLCQHRLQDGEDVTKATNPDLYCLCRKPDDGLFMIQCDFCDEWYHGACIDLTPQLADTMVKFRCPRCQDSG
ncbi:COMPASS component SPP1 [Mytilus galloprovincialis]|uniref:COMPASS component SPP1 n=1 Tax=Mytilus galloprovincialis TaxID=29158 RepID=A0A8B6GXU0_MYTGA|nr:COMPASS component SPP1 [Mytilus galloprovincialis]